MVYSAELERSPVLPATGHSDEVLDIVTEPPHAAHQAPDPKNSLTISLFSKASQDADFTALWVVLKQFLETVPSPRITIDFKNILFLYENEIEYLKKIHKTISVRKGALKLSSCSPELTAILSNDPILQPLIVQ
jgi:hypothetical protein